MGWIPADIPDLMSMKRELAAADDALAAICATPNDWMRDLLLDDDRLRELRSGAVEHASRFTWEKCARQTWNVYEHTLNKQKLPLAA